LNLSLCEKNRSILGTVPERWGRMNQLSQAILLEVGRLLRQAGLLNEGHAVSENMQIGLIVASSWGSLVTDLAYAKDLRSGAQFASPALFGYTLPNIPLAEAAIHYHLTGPVFSLLSEDPENEARAVAGLWLTGSDPRTTCIIAGVLEVSPYPESIISADFVLCYA
jgi:hypothetical protein